MDQLLNSIPKPLLALIIMVIALVVIRFVQPPQTVCDAQLVLFKEQQKRFLYAPDKVGGIEQPSLYKKLTQQCKENNNPGGCFELFEGLRKVASDLEAIPDQCSEAVAAEKVLVGDGKGGAIWNTLTMMVKMAWGERAPASYMQNRGWFDSSEIVLFCRFRKQAIRFQEDEQYREWYGALLKTLPEAEALPDMQRWQRSIVSAPCDTYR